VDEILISATEDQAMTRAPGHEITRDGAIMIALDLLAVLQKLIAPEMSDAVQIIINDRFGGDCTIMQAIEIAFEIAGASAAIAKAEGKL
jgi:hypothetical protein